MAKFRVPLWGRPQGFTTVDTEATKGATIGTDVYNADGSLFEPEASAAEPASVSRTLWSLILDIPATVRALAATTGTGLFAVTGAGVGAFRAITGTSGEIDVADGDAVAGPPTLSLPDVTDAGGGTLQKTAFDTKGRKIGTSAATAADLAYDNTTSGLTATTTQAAIDEVVAGGGGGGATNFTDLGDVPAAYTGEAGKGVAVNATEDGLEFVALTGSGTVTSVGLTNSGGGLTITGSPVTASGSINADLSAATVASLALADSATQPGDLAAVATSGNAADVAVADAGGYFASGDSEGVLQELGAAVAAGGGAGAMTLVGTATVSGSAATALTLSGLDLDSDGSYYIQHAFGNATASNQNLSLFYNGDTASGNYRRSAFGAASVSDAFFGSFQASGYADGTTTIVRGDNGAPRAVVNNVRTYSTGDIVSQSLHSGWVTAANVTSITISSSVASSLAVGSYIKVWKLT